MQRFLEALRNGDERAAHHVIDQALLGGIRATQICADIIGPAMRAIGDLWEAGAMSIAEEHHATQLVLLCLDHIRRTAPRNAAVGATALVACVEGEQHILAGRMMADLLHLDGWDTRFLGADTPVAATVEYIQQQQPRLLVLSARLPQREHALRQTLAGLETLTNPPAVILGGSVPPDGLMPGVDHMCQSLEEGLRYARGVAGLDTGRADLDQYLTGLGQRIHRLRQTRGWSQGELGQLAGLDRTYVSGVERGKQNPTIGALMKLSMAFGLDISAMLVDRELADRPLP